VDLWWVEHCQRVAGTISLFLFFLWLRFNDSDGLINLLYDQFSFNQRDVISILPGVLLLGILIYRYAGTSSNKPLVKYSKLTSFRLMSFTVLWVIYLALYEFYFRGVLLFITFPMDSLAGIVVFNIILYAGIHIVKNLQQVVLSVPFGLLLVGISYYTGHIWFAYAMHLVLALGFELSSLLKHRNKILVG